MFVYILIDTDDGLGGAARTPIAESESPLTQSPSRCNERGRNHHRTESGHVVPLAPRRRRHAGEGHHAGEGRHAGEERCHAGEARRHAGEAHGYAYSYQATRLSTALLRRTKARRHAAGSSRTRHLGTRHL